MRKRRFNMGLVEIPKGSRELRRGRFDGIILDKFPELKDYIFLKNHKFKNVNQEKLKRKIIHIHTYCNKTANLPNRKILTTKSTI
jgi:hypothetical protein